MHFVIPLARRWLTWRYGRRCLPRVLHGGVKLRPTLHCKANFLTTQLFLCTWFWDRIISNYLKSSLTSLQVPGGYYPCPTLRTWAFNQRMECLKKLFNKAKFSRKMYFINGFFFTLNVYMMISKNVWCWYYSSCWNPD